MSGSGRSWSSSGDNICPHCRTGFKTNEGLEEHMEHCVSGDPDISGDMIDVVNLRREYHAVVLVPGPVSQGKTFHRQAREGTIRMACRNVENDGLDPMLVEKAVVSGLKPCTNCWR